MKNTDAAFRDAENRVNQLLRPGLEAIGLALRERIFYKELSPGVFGVFRYAISNLDPIEIYPSVGISYERIQKKFCGLHGIEYQFGAYTLSSPLCYLGPTSPHRLTTIRFLQESSDQQTVKQ